MLQSLKNLRIHSWTQRSVASLRWYSDDEKEKLKFKKEKPKEKTERSLKNPDSVKRLNSLLESMSSRSAKPEIRVQTAPSKKNLPPKVEKPSEDEVFRNITRTIAKKIGGDTDKTESELLSKLLGLKDVKPGGSLSDLISGMKVEAEKKSKFKTTKPGNDEYQSRAENVRKAMGSSRDRYAPRRTGSHPSSGSVNLFGGQPLGLFTKASDTKDPLETWSKLEQRELKLAVTHPPSNYFEKMVHWTEQGKLWKFPIDNEQGRDEEMKVDFSEHVLLDMYLDGWCPPSGPIRHFMELVCVGLGKNHWLTAKEKKDHIFWYRQYFEQKQDMLGDLLTMGMEKQQPKIEA